MRIIYVIIFFCLSHSTLWAQWSNYVNNIDMQKLGGGVHTWDINCSANGWLYFANSDGLFEYHAGKWNRYSPKDDIQLRGVLPCEDEQRVYVSGVGEVGFYEVDERGAMHYTSLKGELIEQNPNIRLDNIWSIERIDNTIYLHEDNSIIKYVGGNFSVINVGHKINTMAAVDGVLYFGTEDGLYMLMGTRAVKCPNSSKLDSKVIREILPLNGAVGVITHKAIYTYDSERVELFDIGLDKFLSENIAFCGAVSHDKLAIGTIRAGVAIYDFASKRTTFQNMQTGLQGNTVLSLFFGDSRLWVGLDGGIDLIFLNSATLTFDNKRNILGSGYSSFFDDNELYLGTNSGLYVHRDAKGVEAIAGAEGQVWSLGRICGSLFSLQDQGVFTLKDGTLSKIEGLRGALSAVEVPYRECTAIVGTYGSMYMIQKEGKEWKLKHKIENCDRYPKKMIFTDDGFLWVYDTSVLFKIELDDDLRRVVSTKVVALPGADRITSFDLVDGELLVSNSSGTVFRIDRNTDIAIEQTKLYRRVVTIISREDKRCYVHPEQIVIVNPDSVVRSVNLPVPINQNSEGIRFLNDSMVVLPHQRGFVLANLNHNYTYNIVKGQAIRSVHATVPADSLLYRANFMERKTNLVIPHSMNSLRIEAARPQTNGATYQYRLSKNGAWSEPSHLAFKEFGNIGAGEHLVSVRITLRDGSIIEEALDLRILPPWYLSHLAYMLYILLLAAIVVGARIYALRRRRQREALLVAEKEAKIHSLEKDMIEQQLRQKSQEMANLLVGAANRNQLFSQIKDDLSVVKSAIGNQDNDKIVEMIVKMNSKLDSNITSEEILRRIESEFDIAHDNFMRDLAARHTNLNHNERMMCAYLRIGLSSKEIAPLLNISTRGVETLRYRIRKKFDLQREDSLRAFLSCGESASCDDGV